MLSTLDITLLLGLVRQLALYAVLATAYTFAGSRLIALTENRRRVYIGLLFGGVAMVGMNMPVVVTNGVLVDARQVMIVLAAAFGGPVSAGIAAILIAVYRYYLGGVGAIPGCVTPFLTVLVSLALIRSFRLKGRSVGLGELAVLGAYIGVISAPAVYALLTLIDPVAATAAVREGGFVIVLSPLVGSPLVGLLLLREDRRRQTERDLADSRRFITSIVDQAPAAIYQRIMKPGGELRYSFVGRSIQLMTGLTPETLLTDGLALYRRTHPDDQAAVTRSIQTSAETLTLWDQTFRLIMADGTVRWLRGTSKPFAENGEIVWDGCLTDVTAQKQAEHALEAARQELETLSLRDGLTGVANRRRFDAALGAELMRGARTGQTLCVLMVDVDHFKLFNDGYGHPAGDRCLQGVAAAIAATVSRPADLVARYGGEEFAIILPETDLDGAETIALRILDHVARENISHIDGVRGRVSVSIGCAISAASDTPATIVERADQALYAAKSAGRNCCRVYRPREIEPGVVPFPLSA